MKRAGIGLLLISVLAIVGSIIWVMITEADSTPLIVYIVIGAAVLGVIMLLVAAISERQKQKKTEHFERRDN